MSNTGIRTAGLVVASGLLLVAIAAPSAAVATPPTSVTGQPVTVCHATNSDTGGYARDCWIEEGQAADGQPSGDITGEATSREAPTGTPTDEAPSGEVEPTDGPTETPDPYDPGDGEVVIDGPFVTPTPPTTPVGAVLGATGAPEMTPPPTDVEGPATAAPSANLQLLLVAVTGLSLLVLSLGRVRVTRRS